MPEHVECSFCGEPIEPGTGKMFVRRDGTVYRFCSSKCQASQLDLKRIPRNVRWTKAHEAERGR